MITVSFAPRRRNKEESDHGSHRHRDVECNRPVHDAAGRRPDRLSDGTRNLRRGEGAQDGPGLCPARRTSHGIAALAGIVALNLVHVPAAQAQTYTVNLNPTLNGLDVKIEPVPQTGLLVVKLTNATAQKVRCRLKYDASPQTPYRSSVYLNPGKTEQDVFRAQRKWFSVDVDVECSVAKK